VGQPGVAFASVTLHKGYGVAFLFDRVAAQFETAGVVGDRIEAHEDRIAGILGGPLVAQLHVQGVADDQAGLILEWGSLFLGDFHLKEMPYTQEA